MTPIDTPPPVCPRCGTSLSHDAPEGLCPRCLAAINFETGSLVTGAGTSLPPPPIEELAPHFPQLELLSCLGRGGMGVVYKARQISLDRLVALKLLAPEREKDPEFAERFAREAQALAKMSHPHIVTIHDFGQAGGFYYLLMEYVDGANLRQLLQSHKFTPEQALAVVPPLCDALQYAHDRGIVHRDIKPENLLMDREGRLKVADFGLAKMLGNQIAGDERPVGTPDYMAPEQVENPVNVDNRADIYSLGVVIYEMLTGELPGKNFEPPSSKSHVDARLDEVVQRALNHEPDQRYQQASILKTAVEGISQGPPPAPTTAAPPPPPSDQAPDLSTARNMVTAPAIAMMIAGGLWTCGVLVNFLLAFTILFLPRVGTPKVFIASPLLGISVPNLNSVLAGHPRISLIFAGGWMIITVGLSVMVILGGHRMRSLRHYRHALAGAIILIVNGALQLPGGSSISFSAMLSLLNLGVGIWALVILRREDIKRAFQQTSSSGASTTPAVPVVQRDPAVIRRKLTIPAIGLMVASAINLLVLAASILLIIVKSTSSGHQSMVAWTPLICIPLITIPSVITLAGAWRMRQMKSYGLAVTAAILTLITPPGLLLGLIFSIWALVLLCQEDVKAGFRSNQSKSSGKGCLIAIAVVVVTLLLMILLVLGLRVVSVRSSPRTISSLNVAPTFPDTPHPTSTPAPIQIRGTVVNEAGQPIALARVARIMDGKCGPILWTDSSGNFDLPTSDGPQTLNISAGDYDATEVQFTRAGSPPSQSGPLTIQMHARPNLLPAETMNTLNPAQALASLRAFESALNPLQLLSAQQTYHSYNQAVKGSDLELPWESLVILEQAMQDRSRTTEALAVLNRNEARMERLSCRERLAKLSSGQPPLPTEQLPPAVANDFAARYEACRMISDFVAKSHACASLAKEAAAAGNVAVAKLALQQISDFTERDEARRGAAFALCDRGQRSDSVEIAKLIGDFTLRDETLLELAKRNPVVPADQIPPSETDR